MINKAILTGRLTAAPELKSTQSGTLVTGFTIAVARRFKLQDGTRPTDFINCVAWRNTAEYICKNFGKGDMIGVVGEIQTRKYTDKDGKKCTAFEIVVDEAEGYSGKNNRDEEATPATPTFEELSNDDDLPF